MQPSTTPILLDLGAGRHAALGRIRECRMFMHSVCSICNDSRAPPSIATDPQPDQLAGSYKVAIPQDVSYQSNHRGYLVEIDTRSIW